MTDLKQQNLEELATKLHQHLDTNGFYGDNQTTHEAIGVALAVKVGNAGRPNVPGATIISKAIEVLWRRGVPVINTGGISLARTQKELAPTLSSANKQSETYANKAHAIASAFRALPEAA